MGVMKARVKRVARQARKRQRICQRRAAVEKWREGKLPRWACRSNCSRHSEQRSQARMVIILIEDTRPRANVLPARVTVHGGTPTGAYDL